MLKICIYIGINAHVTPADAQTHTRKCESRAVFCWGRIRNIATGETSVRSYWLNILLSLFQALTTFTLSSHTDDDVMRKQFYDRWCCKEKKLIGIWNVAIKRCKNLKCLNCGTVMKQLWWWWGHKKILCKFKVRVFRVFKVPNFISQQDYDVTTGNETNWLVNLVCQLLKSSGDFHF